MWQSFKSFLTLCIIFLSSYAALAQESNIIFNLRQNWLYYDQLSEGFLPVVANYPGNAISFSLDGEQFSKKQLYIYVGSNKETSLFYKNKLIASLKEGNNYFDIDSLTFSLKTNAPFLTVYGKSVSKGLQTYVVNKGYINQSNSNERFHFRSASFSSFFIFASILLYITLALIKFRVSDLFRQYTVVQRALNPQTIDELIYKGRFFGMPSIFMVTWMSFASGLILTFLFNKLNIHTININAIDNGTVFFYLVYWLMYSLGFFLLFLFRYGLVVIMASVFDMSSVRNVHYATHLRLTYYLLVILLALITLDYFSIISIGRLLIIGVVFSTLLAIIILTGIRLSFIIRHTFVHLFLYLCGTEIFLFVFVYKLVVG